MINENIFNKVKKKTKVDKDMIVSLAEKLQKDGLKNENTLRDVIQTLSKITGKEVPKEREDKIVETIINDKVPKNVDKMF